MEDNTMEHGLVLGMDIGDKKTHFAVIDTAGELVEQGVVSTTPEAFKNTFGRFSKITMTLEVGRHSRWVSLLLCELGHLVYVANPRQLKLIYGSTDKDDKLDAERLARLTRLDSKLLHAITHRSEEAQADLELLKARDVLVETRTKMVNHVRGVLKSFGVTVQSGVEGFASKVLDFIPENLKFSLLPLVEALQAVASQIREIDRRVQNLCRGKYKLESSTLQQINGVGPILSLNYILRLGNPHRFKNSRTVGAYIGLRPRRSSSGEKNPELRITKAGDTKLRSLLVQSAQYILGFYGKDCDLRRWGLKKAEGGQRSKKRAVIAVARKLSVLLHRLLVTGEVYEPFRNAPAVQAA